MICAENEFALQVSKLSELSASALIFLVHHRVTRGGSKPHVRHMHVPDSHRSLLPAPCLKPKPYPLLELRIVALNLTSVLLILKNASSQNTSFAT